MGIEIIWDELTDLGALSVEHASRAKARFDQAGGGLDTAIAEVSNLDAARWKRVMDTLSRTLGYPLAKPGWLDLPDHAGWSVILGAQMPKVAVLPAWTDQALEIYVIPPLAPHVITQTLRSLPEHRPLYFAAESEIWDALSRHHQVPAPARFECLWLGQCPGLDIEKSGDAWGPMPFATLRVQRRGRKPRVTESVPGGRGSSASAEKKTRDTAQILGTSPARPRALGLAETEEHRHVPMGTSPWGLAVPQPRPRDEADEDIFAENAAEDPTAVDHPSSNDGSSPSTENRARIRFEPTTSPPS